MVRFEASTIRIMGQAIYLYDTVAQEISIENKIWACLDTIISPKFGEIWSFLPFRNSGKIWIIKPLGLWVKHSTIVMLGHTQLSLNYILGHALTQLFLWIWGNLVIFPFCNSGKIWTHNPKVYESSILPLCCQCTINFLWNIYLCVPLHD